MLVLDEVDKLLSDDFKIIVAKIISILGGILVLIEAALRASNSRA